MEVLEQLNSQWRVVLESCSNTQANVRSAPLLPLPEDLLHLQVLRLCVSQQLLRFLECLGEALPLLLLRLLLLDQPVPLDALAADRAARSHGWGHGERGVRVVHLW